MATAAETAPVNHPSVYGGVTEGGIGSGLSVRPEAPPPEMPPPEILPPQRMMSPTLIQLSTPYGESAKPEGKVLFGALSDPQLYLLEPIPLTVTNEGSDVVLTWDEIDEFGCGDKTTTAIDDFAQSLRELYHHLHSKEVQLGSDLLRVKGILDQYIARR